MNLKNGITIFTDGSSRGNPGPGGFGAIIMFYDSCSMVHELGGREDLTTNNRMELSAVINALIYVDENDLKGEIVILTDSKYVINGITSWVSGWQKNGWKTTAKKGVENKDLWEALIFATSGLSIKWKYVEGHAGHPGNERCDEIATSFADNEKVSLYDGEFSKYPVDLNVTIPVGERKTSKNRSNAKAYSYVSRVNGKIEISKTWAECGVKVKEKSGAKYKKVFSRDEETALISEWGK